MGGKVQPGEGMSPEKRRQLNSDRASDKRERVRHPTDQHCFDKVEAITGPGGWVKMSFWVRQKEGTALKDALHALAENITSPNDPPAEVTHEAPSV